MKYSVIFVMMLCMTAFAHPEKNGRLQLKDGGVTDVCGVAGGDGTTCDDRCGIPNGNDACVAAIEAAALEAYKISAEQNATIAAAESAAVDAYKASAQFDTDAETAYLDTLDACGVSGGSTTNVADCPSASIDLSSDSDCQTAKDYFNAQCNCADY